jgi:hypothetical protein
MFAEDIETESQVFMSLLKTSEYVKEGCASTRLEPMEAARGMRPFSGDGYILKYQILLISPNNHEISVKLCVKS